MITKRTERILKLRHQLELAEIQLQVHQHDCPACLRAITSVTAPVCGIALEQLGRAREANSKLAQFNN